MTSQELFERFHRAHLESLRGRHLWTTLEPFEGARGPHHGVGPGALPLPEADRHLRAGRIIDALLACVDGIATVAKLLDDHPGLPV